jgi:hypothetical protein
MKTLPVVAILAVGISLAAGVTYLIGQSQVTALQSDNDALQTSLVSKQQLNDTLQSSLVSNQQISAFQEGIATSLRAKLVESVASSLGDRLVVTEAVYEELPKTIGAAEALGYILIDKVGSDGKMIEAACFDHEDTLHYAQPNPRVTQGSEWHGAPFLLLYSSSAKNLKGMVLESTTLQPSPPWEYHAGGHPGMNFAHSSLHLWFSDPPVNLSLKQS